MNVISRGVTEPVSVVDLDREERKRTKKVEKF